MTLPHSLRSNTGPQGSPVYPKGLDPTGSEVCSATYQCRGGGDLWDAPAGTVALSFDDGPLAPSPRLYKFLKGNNVHATHFFIGGNVRTYEAFSLIFRMMKPLPY